MHARVQTFEVRLFAALSLSVCHGTTRFPLVELSGLRTFRKASQGNSSSLGVTRCSRHSS